MQLDLKTTNLELTSPLKEYVEKRLEPLSRFVKRYEEKGEVRMFVELARITRHHQKGNVFYAEANVELPGKIVRAEATHEDIRAAVDVLKDVLKREFKKYKDRHLWKK